MGEESAEGREEWEPQVISQALSKTRRKMLGGVLQDLLPRLSAGDPCCIAQGWGFSWSVGYHVMRVFSIQADSLEVVEGGVGGGAKRTQLFCGSLGETTVASAPACGAVCSAGRALSSEGEDEQAHGEPLALDPTAASVPAVVLSKSGYFSRPAHPLCLESKGRRLSLSGNQKQNRGWTLAPLPGSCLERCHSSPQQSPRLSTIDDTCGGGQSSPGA